MKTIYYVHDQQGQPASVAHFLELSGYKVELCPSGDQCLEMLTRAVPSLILMDVLLEGRNGFDVCRAIRQHFAPEALPVVLCSAIYRSRIYREEAMHAGAQLYVLKPVKFDELTHMIHELLDANACLLSAQRPEGEPDDVRTPSGTKSAS